MMFLKEHRVVLLSVAIMVVAFSIRAPRAVEGLPYLHHSDEPMIASVALEMLKTGDFNPHYYNYPSLMMYLNLLVDIPHFLYLVGQPDDAEAVLSGPSDIKTYHDTDWKWTISHPSFYKWNRLLTCFFGAGTAVVMFLFGLRVFRETWVALVPAIFITVLPFHVSNSAYITTDVPAWFFVVCASFFSLCYFQEGRLKYLVWGLIFCGLSAGTKYNAVFIVVPIIFAVGYRYFVDRKSMNHFHWMLVPVVPLVAFLITNPYAFLDLGSFLNGVGYEVRHYKVRGHNSYTTNPGWDQLWYQMSNYYEELGFAIVILVVVGLGAVLFRRDLAFIFIYPVVFLVFMVQMKVNFLRNYAQLYPYWGLFLAAGLLYLTAFLRGLEKFFKFKYRGVLVVLLWAVVGASLIRMAGESVVESYVLATTKDPRTLGIELVNRIDNAKRVVLAKELRFHGEDLRKLRLPRQVESLSRIHRMSTVPPGTVFVVPASLSMTGSRYKRLRLAKNKTIIDAHEQYVENIRKEWVVEEIGDNLFYLNGINITGGPGLVVYHVDSSSARGTGALGRGSVPGEVDRDWSVKVGMGETVTLSGFVLSSGSYTMSFNSKYSEGGGAPIGLTIAVIRESDGEEVKRDWVQQDTPESDLSRGYYWRFSREVKIKKAGTYSIKIWLYSALAEDRGLAGGTLYLKNIEVRGE